MRQDNKTTLDTQPEAGVSRRRLRAARKFAHMMVVCIVLFPVVTSAQGFRGSVTGKVLDPAGAGVPGARVMLTSRTTNVSIVFATDESGYYAIPFVNPGVYDITVEAVGFKKILRRGVEVRVGDKLAVDFSLEVGELREIVNVTN